MSDRLENGTIVDGRYRVVDRLGAGGMADVYRAEDLQLGRPVALKLLYRRFAEDAEFSERFRREASSAAGLQHPNVVGVYDRGTYAQTAYIAMEYVDGRTLKQIVNREGPLEPARAVALVEQVLRAAQFAHRRGVIHRDLKPHNVIVDADDRAKVTDFGIAKAGASDMTETGSIMGTAQYLSPEQAQGLPVSAESDLYSIGIMLYELLTGEIPFDGDSAVTIALKQVSEPPISPSIMKGRPGSVPPALEQVVLKALAKAPGDRFADAAAFIEALDEAMEHPDRTPAAVLVGGDATDQDAGGETIAVPMAAPPAPLPAYGPVGPPLSGPEHEEGRGGSGRWWFALLALLVVAGIAVGAVLLVGAKKVTVPSVVGADQAQAQQTLRARGLNSNAVPRQSTRAEGTVIGQDPAPGSRAEEQSTVDLTISSGPGDAVVPDLGSQRRLAARKTLEGLGFVVAERREASDTITTNRVIETVPGAGNSLERGQSVTLVLSSGAERVSVPSVRGQTEAQARAVLEGARFVVKTREREDEDADPGTVIEQAPTAGAAVGRGSTVTLTLAKAPATVTVPDVRGRSQQAAGNALLDAGFNIDAETTPVDDAADNDRVVTQSPAAGQKIKRGATVTITVGVAPSDGDSGSDGGVTPTETTPPATATTTTPTPTSTVATP